MKLNIQNTVISLSNTFINVIDLDTGEINIKNI